jgi:hypothetical protein
MHHGNWCGPGWSDGKEQPSVRGFAPGIDEFDMTCRDHDFAYADKGDLAAADFQFFKDNFPSTSAMRTFAALGVGGQGVARHAVIKMSKQTQRLRSQPEPEPTCAAIHMARPVKKIPSNSARARSAQKAIGISAPSKSRAAPAAYSNTVSGYKVSSNAGVTTVRGREYAAGSGGYNSATTQMTDAIFHHPAHYATSALGNMARSFREYRWDAIRVSYVATCPTSTQGWTQIVTNPDVQEAAYLYTSNTDLLQRSMCTQNAVLGNTWENLVHVVPTDKKWCLTQPFDGSDIRDHCAGETYVYTNSTSTSVLGLIVIDYVISFRDLYYTLHSSIPFAQYATLAPTDSVANPSTSAIVEITSSALTSGYPAGTIWRLILMADQSTAGTGATLSNAWKTYVDGNSTNTLPIQNGTTVYATVIATTAKLYPTFEAAKIASSSMYIAYGNTQTTASTYKVQAVRMTLGLSDMTSQS